jgi:hypothetical protein
VFNNIEVISMNRKNIFILLIIFILVLTGCNRVVPEEESEILFEPLDYEKMENFTFDCQLFVDGNEIPTDDLVGINREERYAIVPVVKIIEAAGGKVEWKNDTIASIKINGSKFELNTIEQTLYCKDKSFPNYNFLEPVTGATIGAFYHTLDKELLVDNLVFTQFAYSVMNSHIDISYNRSAVYIEYVN